MDKEPHEVKKNLDIEKSLKEMIDNHDGKKIFPWEKKLFFLVEEILLVGGGEHDPRKKSGDTMDDKNDVHHFPFVS